MLLPDLQRAGAPLAGRRVQRFPLGGMRELRARRSTRKDGLVSFVIALHDAGNELGHFILPAQDLRALARAVVDLAARTPRERRREVEDDVD